MNRSFYDPVVYRSHHSLADKLYLLGWRVTRSVCFQFTPARLNGIRIALLRIFGGDVADTAVIHPTCRIYSPRTLRIGERSCLAERVDCYSVAAIDIGDDVTVSQDAFLCTASHDIDAADRHLVTRPIRIEDGAWVFARAIILPGVTLARGAVVAAGAVVHGDVAQATVVAGNPAQAIRERRHCPPPSGHTFN
jgi:putative colanic acid biosynthesis acetyltransferase WcaF